MKPVVKLRDATLTDLPDLFEMQLDVESNEMAAMHPRSKEKFDSHWKQFLKDESVVVKAIEVDGQMVGDVTCFESDGTKYVGYWVKREHWGRGIASDALRQLIEVLPDRPLEARVAKTNAASIRVLQKNGFEIVREEFHPGDDHLIACMEVILQLS